MKLSFVVFTLGCALASSAAPIANEYEARGAPPPKYQERGIADHFTQIREGPGPVLVKPEARGPPPPKYQERGLAEYLTQIREGPGPVLAKPASVISAILASLKPTSTLASDIPPEITPHKASTSLHNQPTEVFRPKIKPECFIGQC